jgi:hypothetical protein
MRSLLFYSASSSLITLCWLDKNDSVIYGPELDAHEKKVVKWSFADDVVYEAAISSILSMEGASYVYT